MYYLDCTPELYCEEMPYTAYRPKDWRSEKTYSIKGYYVAKSDEYHLRITESSLRTTSRKGERRFCINIPAKALENFLQILKLKNV